jgi:hypothetical protein
MTFTRGPDCTVITYANNGLSWGALEKAINQVKFTHGSELNRKASG